MPPSCKLLQICAFAACALLVFSCESPLENQEEQNVVDTKAPVITVQKSSVNVIAGLVVGIGAENLQLGGETVASWKDDVTHQCKVSLSMDGVAVANGSKLAEAGILQLSVADEAGNAAQAEIQLVREDSIPPQVSVTVKEKNLITGAVTVTLENGRLLLDGAEAATWKDDFTATCKTELSFIPAGGEAQAVASGESIADPGTLRLMVTDDFANSATAEIVMVFHQAPVEIRNLAPEEILPIVGQIEKGDVHEYEHIDHLRLAEATRIRDMMWEYGAGDYSVEEYRALMGRLNTGMIRENPIGYNNYEIVGGEFCDSPSEHAHDEWFILTTLVKNANLIVINSWGDDVEWLYKLSVSDKTAINIFGLSKGADVYSKEDYWDMSNWKQNLQVENLILFKTSGNVVQKSGVLLGKSSYIVCQEDEDLPNERAVYSGVSCANGKNDPVVDRHMMVTVGTNPAGDVNVTQLTEGSKYPLGFHNDVLFAGRYFPILTTDGYVRGDYCYSSTIGYCSSYPNYVNVSMTDLCFQMFADVKDADELLGMIWATSLTDVVRYDLMSQPLHLINPAGYILKYLTPSVPEIVSLSETTVLEKGYYKGVVFDIPGAEVCVDGEWLPVSQEFMGRIGAANPFTLDWRLSGSLLTRLGYTIGSTVEGRILLVDDTFSGLRMEMPVSFTVQP